MDRAAARYPVVSVNGPRQSGKTTLLSSAFPRHRYVSLESPDERTFALEDPHGFLGRFDGPAIKSGETVAGDFFKGLAHWRSLAGPSAPATVVYGGHESYVRGGVDVRA